MKLELKPITLSVKRSKFRMDDPLADHHNLDYAKVRKTVKQAQNHTCQYCGLKSNFQMETHHIDDDHSNNQPDNLDTICILCHSCFHLGYSGATERGELGYFPEEYGLDQGTLNTIIRTLWIGKRSEDPDFSEMCSMLLTQIDSYSSDCKIIVQSNSPIDLAEFLLLLEDDEYSQRHKIFKNNILFIPNESAFEPYIKAWSEELENKHPPALWSDSAKQKIYKMINKKDVSDMELLTYILEIN